MVTQRTGPRSRWLQNPGEMKSSKVRNTFFASAICLLLAARMPAIVSPEVVDWFVDPLIKGFPDDAPSPARGPAPEFFPAPNSHLSVQWVLRSGERLDNLTVTAEGFE